MTAACLAPGAFFVVYGLAVYDDDQELGHFFGSLEIAVGLLLMLGASRWP